MKNAFLANMYRNIPAKFQVKTNATIFNDSPAKDR